MTSQLSPSLSDSVHTSLIARDQQHSKRNLKDKSRDETGDSTEELSLGVQCLLVMVFAGLETGAVFSFIYNILFLQFVGIPTSLLSVPGVIGGATTILLLPFLGWFMDRGSNPMSHKLKLMFFTLGIFILGFTSLAIVSASKFNSFRNKLSHENDTTRYRDVCHKLSLIKNQTIGNKSILSGISIHNQVTREKTNIQIVTDPDLTSDKLGYLSIISFGLLDFGYDSSMAIARAFIVECSPPSTHGRLLILASICGSVAGTSFSFIFGIVDFPGNLGPFFKVDGTAATVFMLSCLLLTFTSLCFACTMVTGYVINRRNGRIKKTVITPENSSVESRSKIVTNQQTLEQSWKNSGSKMSSSTDGLFSNTKFDKKSYSAFSTTSVGEIIGGQKSSFAESDKDPHEKYESHENNRNDNPEHLKSIFEYHYGDHCNDPETFHFQAMSESDNNSCSERMISDEIEPDHIVGSSNMMAGLRASYSMSLSTAHITFLGDYKNRKTNNVTPSFEVNDNEGSRKLIWKNKRLLILCLSMFFTMGAMVIIVIYANNALTIGVYHGQPTAPQGTRGKDLYDKGIQNGALGQLVLYIAYALSSLLNKNVVGLIGEKVPFVVSHVILVAVMVVFVFEESEELYFATMVSSGIYRACSYSLGYVLVAKLVYEKYEELGSNETPANHDIGKVMVLFGFLMPGHYLVMSLAMGPMISATGNVWVPIIYGAACTALSLLIFSLLFVVKK